jgi:AhpD family alkylhydroperoxidase
MTEMRITGIDPQNAPESVQPVFQGSLNFFGRVITPSLVMAHRPEILLAHAKLGQAISASTVVEGRLKTMVSVRAAQMVGCPFWVDINSAVGRGTGITDEQLETLAAFETSPHFDDREKAVLRYAEGMTRTPADVPDAVFAEIQALFSTEQIVELTAAIALENFRARFNCALKIESDSLCMLPPDHPVRKLRE